MNQFICFLIILGLLLVIGISFSQEFVPNYDETKVPTFKLPDPLQLENGKRVKKADVWWKKRRPEIFKLFEEQVYGKMPDKFEKITYKLLEMDSGALAGKAIRKQVTVYLVGREDGPKMDLLIYLPNQAHGPVPVFLALNFYGNHTIHADPNITMTDSWVQNNKEFGITQNQATDFSRGIRASRWPVAQILARGYGLATIYYGDIDPDFDDGFQNGVHPFFYKQGQTQPEPDEWGSIAAWAWGLSRAMDYLETDKSVDSKKVIVMGHSRLGKTSVWAGAADQRFAIVISNNSGCGGAALSRRQFGETVGRINRVFPHWFCDNFNRYNENEAALPIDQHQLLALIAPRPLYVASAEEDRWADPKGEFLAAKYASPVYELLGKKGIPADAEPKIHEPIMTTIGYHIRAGKHDVTRYDWERYMDFADLHLKNK